MAIAEQEVAEQKVAERFSVRMDREQQEKLAQAAQVTGQSLDEFAATALVRAADAALTSPLLVRSPIRSLDSVLGIFRDEPLLDAMMARIHAERQAQMEQEMEAEETEAAE